MPVTIKRAQRVLRRKPRQPVRAPSPRSAAAPAVQPLYAYRQAFVEWTVARGLSPQTAKLRASALDMFIVWCGERGLTRPQDITRPILQRYQVHLYHYRKSKGKDSGAPLTIRTQATRLLALVAFFKWLVRDNHLLTNPAADLELPRLPRRLPQRVLTVAETEGILNLPDLATPQGVRNRALLEMLYSTGIRRAELTGLALYDADPREGTLMVREGKGRRDRLLPLGARACAWLERYLTEVRPQLVCGADRGALFLTDYGEPFEKNRLGDLVRRYLRQAGIDKGSCHAFRHAMATHMLDNGADIRFIQAMLGHSELSTTQIYTQVAIGKLKAVHALTHPARLMRPPETRHGAGAALDGPMPRDGSRDGRVDAAAALLGALEAEAEGEDAAEDGDAEPARP